MNDERTYYIYKYVEKNTGETYVGKSEYLLDRLKYHKNNDKWCIENNFDIYVMELTSQVDIDIAESYFISKYESCKNGFNIAKDWGKCSLSIDFGGREWIPFDDNFKRKIRQKRKYKKIQEKTNAEKTVMLDLLMVLCDSKTIMLTRESREPFIKKLNIRKNGRIVKNRKSLNNILKNEYGITEYEIKEFKTNRKIDGEIKQFHRAWKIVKT